MKKEYKNKGFAPIIACALAISVFALSLTLAINALGSADGQKKAARGAPDSLVSAGAPRSQLELKRMFDSMSRSYTELGKSVYEPLIDEYKQSRELSVEEILYIISDTVDAFGKYDVIRLGEIDMNTFEASQSSGSPLHISAYDRISAIKELIRLRIEYMSGYEMTEGEGGELRYSDSPFVFSNDRIVFEAANGKRVLLYPDEKESILCRTKVLVGSANELTENERLMVSSFGYDPTRTRNITPDYWYGETDIRLFVFGGKVLLADPTLANCTELLPEGHKLSSAALVRGKIYFTSSHDGGATAWKYEDGELIRIFDSSEKYLAVIERESYESAELYTADPIEDGRFVIALECIGEPIEVYS